MTRGPRPYRALSEAVTLARLRGTVQMAGPGPESLYDLTIISAVPVVFVRVKFAARILASLQEIIAEFRDAILRLRSIPQDAAISRELWLRSKHGTWRLFRVAADGLTELDRDGRPLAGG